MTITRKFTRNGVNSRRLSYNAKTRTLFLAATQAFHVDPLRRETFPTVDAARAAWAEWQGHLEADGFQRGETFTR